MTGTANSLYVAADNGFDTDILRLDPATGAVLAHSALSVNPAATMLLVDGTLWVPPSSVRPRDTFVHGLDPRTLRTTTTLTLHSARDTQVSGFTASTLEHRLFIGLGATVTIIDTRTKTVTGHYRTPHGTLSDIAASPDSNRLYATYTRTFADGQYSYLSMLNADTGQPIGAPVQLLDGLGGALTSSRGGVWVTLGSGMEQSISFHPADRLSYSRTTPAGGGGGVPPTVSATDRVVWEGGDVALVCADPKTGTTRAAARTSSPHDNATFIISLTAAGTGLFAFYSQPASGRTRLIRLTPPRSCTAR